MFRSTQNKGFSITFENGNTISVQFGPGNYCDARDLPCEWDAPMKQDSWSCEVAEIAIWDKDKVWFKFPYDTVKGWVKPEEVAEWISYAATTTDFTSKQNEERSKEDEEY